MSTWFRKLFGSSGTVAQIDHPLYGRIAYSKRHGWENEQFNLWGYSDVPLMIDADERGPTPRQDAAFIAFRDQRDTLLPRCLSAVAATRTETELPAGNPRLTALSIPSLAGGRTGTLWTMWWDYPGEEHWSYGVQSDDEWRTVQGFAED